MNGSIMCSTIFSFHRMWLIVHWYTNMFRMYNRDGFLNGVYESKTFTVDEFVKAFSPPFGLSLWLDVELLSYDDREMQIKLDMSIRFRKTKEFVPLGKRTSTYFLRAHFYTYPYRVVSARYQPISKSTIIFAKHSFEQGRCPCATIGSYPIK